MNDLLKPAIDGHGGMRRWEQISWFRAAASIAGAIWALKGRPGLLEDVILDGETRDQRLTMTPFPQPGRYTTWEPTGRPSRPPTAWSLPSAAIPRRHSPG